MWMISRNPSIVHDDTCAIGSYGRMIPWCMKKLGLGIKDD
jgi:hypothetical protein